MTDRLCKTCVRFRSTTGPGGWLETCGDNGPSISFARAEHGVFGDPHCGVDGKYWREK